MSVEVVERSTDTHNISNKAVQKCLCEILFHNNTKNIDLAEVRREVIIRDDPEYAS